MQQAAEGLVSPTGSPNHDHRSQQLGLESLVPCLPSQEGIQARRQKVQSKVRSLLKRKVHVERHMGRILPWGAHSSLSQDESGSEGFWEE